MGGTNIISDDTEEDTRLDKKLLARKVSSIDTSEPATLPWLNVLVTFI
jgi:hypothetical protein